MTKTESEQDTAEESKPVALGTRPLRKLDPDETARLVAKLQAEPKEPASEVTRVDP